MTSLKIGIDIHSIGSGKGGNETYYRELVEGLRDLEGNHDFVLYHVGPQAPGSLASKSRFAFQQLRPASRMLRIPLTFPWRMRREKLDVFHAQYIVPPFSSCKTVVSIFDLAHERFPEFFHPFEAKRSQMMVRWSARRADHIVTVSHFSARDLTEIYGVDPRKITVTHLAASRDFHPMDRDYCREFVAKKYGIAGPFVLYAGRLQARKNLVRLVEAYGQLKQRGLKEKLVLVGKSDWQAGQIVETIARLGLQSDVILLGYVPQSDLPIILNAAQLFVYPSIFEGFGLPVIESMACGIPTITSLGSSLEEVAGDAAILIDPMSVSSIVDAIEKVMQSSELRAFLSQKGVERSAQFSYRTAAAQTLRVYENVQG
ncbi:MAG TPA: glycosyltransferase family 1 protein [Terriglobales bacterium]|jgi:glycosyltransferase involved in cell wall biosynthesis|nr:glycosyltransferase family 1 protein [Terriglobales bacterium]